MIFIKLWGVCTHIFECVKVLGCLRLMHSLKQNIGLNIQGRKILHSIPISIFITRTFDDKNVQTVFTKGFSDVVICDIFEISLDCIYHA